MLKKKLHKFPLNLFSLFHLYIISPLTQPGNIKILLETLVEDVRN